MNTSNLNRPAIYTERKLDETDFANLDTDEPEGMPMPTRAGQIVGAVLCVVSAVLMIAFAAHMIARAMP